MKCNENLGETRPSVNKYNLLHVDPIQAVWCALVFCDFFMCSMSGS